ncbi:DEAD/DEAH box helicase family protein [Metamycoplasma auris]|nr:DEAD/DEAH box helicase family protein [Metamycoplasma auris]
MHLTNAQSKAVNKILSKFDSGNKKIIDFQAPTGSGKTFMILNVIDKLITEHPEQKFVFVIMTLSSSSLPKQMYESFIDYKEYLVNKDLEFEYITPPSSKDKSLKKKDQHHQIFAKKNKIFIFGNQSFGKKRKFTEEGIIDSFLSQIENEEFNLVYIRDEAHFGGEIEKKNKYIDLELNKDINKLWSKTKDLNVRAEVLLQKYAHFIIKMTATPKGHNDLVILSEADLIEDDILLIKKTGIYNQGLNEIKEDTITNRQILEVACKKFKKIKERYADATKEETLININPAMLIQVNNKDKSNKETFDANINEIISVLKEHNLNYVKYFGEDDFESNIRLSSHSLNSISKNSSDVDVIIFKLGPATGWNIPRACMLVQLRNISSSTLTIQTLGRIKRNPNPNAIAKCNSISLKYYYYSNLPESNKSHINIFLRDQYKKETFNVGYIDKQEVKRRIQNENYIDEVIEKLDLSFIRVEFERYKNEYQKNGYISVYTEKFGTKKVAVTKISNNIELEIYKENFLRKNKTYFPPLVISAIENFKNNDSKRLNDLKVDDFSINLFWLIIEKNYLFEIKKLFYKQINDLDNLKDKIYKIESNYLLPERVEIFIDDSKRNPINLPYLDYAYKSKSYLNNIETNGEKNEQYFDSNTENKFVDLIKYYVRTKKNEYNIKVWTKNPVFHGVFVEYFNHDNEISKAYPDFIFRIIDKNDVDNYHDFYIEIKSSDDIDPKKTEKIIESYKNYLNIKENNLIDDQYPKMTLLLLEINSNSTHEISYHGSSFINKINSELNQNNKNDTIEKLVEFFKLSISKD